MKEQCEGCMGARGEATHRVIDGRDLGWWCDPCWREFLQEVMQMVYKSDPEFKKEMMAKLKELDELLTKMEGGSVVFRIFKYKIEIGGTTELTLPKGAKVLSFQCQREVPCIWVLLDADSAEQEKRAFIIIGTGQPITQTALEGLEFIGTAQMAEGALVWHLFEIKR